MNAKYLNEIIVAPESGTTGQNLIAVINCLDLLARFPAVVVADVECNGNRSWAQQLPLLKTTREVLDYAASVGQFDWATLFFFARVPSEPAEGYQYESLFVDSELTVRAVDDTYFYVYSGNAGDASRLGQIFRVESENKRSDTIVHPF